MAVSVDPDQSLRSVYTILLYRFFCCNFIKCEDFVWLAHAQTYDTHTHYVTVTFAYNYMHMLTSVMYSYM